jgi:dihydroorotase-like cyclic amidohydrolase
MTMHITGAQVLHKGIFKALDLLIEGTRIVAMGEQLLVPAGTAVIDAAGLFLVPGFIDVHTQGRWKVISIMPTQSK